ncbi:acyl-CoA N-acyltransferase [Dunaliella salina]|uniref:Acyl-CoA N-acyltransferase n=1 Tax=Dunaliella salina TaxID=3046 RepID=A0ABQ7GR96_DUNSA|nr:acyl-CoA N-acyltransferase [Dunaliella salina]|eukprot:KAF5837131.1 acyl-CoA N-acyltransferase [Dunaliella salina]
MASRPDAPPAPGTAADLAIAVTSLHEGNLQALKLMNGIIFPVKYSDQVYKDCMQFPHITALAYHQDTLVGAIMGRLEVRKGQDGSSNCVSPGGARLYIASLGVLAPYRGYKVGSQLLMHSLAGAAEDPMVKEAVVHMHVANEDGQRFYERHGFKVTETIPNYYRFLDPPDALVLVRPLR